MSDLVKSVAFAICTCNPCICKNRAGFEGMPCLETAQRGIAAYQKFEREENATRFGPNWQTKLAWAIRQMELLP